MINLDQAAKANKYNRNYDEGKLAAIEGHDTSKNPYAANSQEAIAWIDGWIDGNNYKQMVSA